MSKRLFVSNLPFSVNERDLEATFSQMGKVVSARVVKGPQGRSKGFGFVEMAEELVAQKAQIQFDNEEFEGRTIRVSFATGAPKERAAVGGGKFKNRRKRWKPKHPARPTETSDSATAAQPQNASQGESADAASAPNEPVVTETNSQ